MSSQSALIAPATIDIKLLPFYGDILNDRTHSEIAIPGGKGCGKSFFGVIWHWHRCEINRGFDSWWITPDMFLARMAQENFIRFLNFIGWKQGAHYEVVKSPEPRIDLLVYGHRIFFRSTGSNLEGANLSHITFDEVGDCDEDGVRDACDRVRTVEVPLKQKLFMGKPQGLNHYYRRFEMPDAKLYGRFNQFKSDGERLVLHYRTYWNDKLDPAYVLRQIDNYGHSPQYVRAYILGQFCRLFEKSVYNFDDSNITPEAIMPNPDYGTVTISWDFNVGQVAYSAWQERGKISCCVEEAPANCMNTDEACMAISRQFDSRFRNVDCTVKGDASGRSGDTRSYTDDYAIIRSALSKVFRSVKISVPPANGPVRISLLATNRALTENVTLKRGRQLYISRHCSKTIDSMFQTHYNDNGEIAKPSGDTWTHRSDTVRYHAVTRFPVNESQSAGLFLTGKENRRR